MNNLLRPLSPCVRSAWCCTTRPCPPCCGSGWRPGTFINRWPRSRRRARMVTRRRRPLNSSCWGERQCVPAAFWSFWLCIGFGLCVYFLATLQAVQVFASQLFVVVVFASVITLPDWDCEMWVEVLHNRWLYPAQLELMIFSCGGSSQIIYGNKNANTTILAQTDCLAIIIKLLMHRWCFMLCSPVVLIQRVRPPLNIKRKKHYLMLFKLNNDFFPPHG